MPARPPLHPSVGDRLVEIARDLEAAHHARPGSGASLVRLRGLVDDEVEVALAPVTAPDLLDVLVGTVTPSEWEAAGVVTEGAARELSADGATAGPPRGGIRAAVICHRDGTIASVLRRDGAAPIEALAGPDDPGPIGRVVDALRRSVGRPTPPPTGPVGLVVAQVWLHRVLGVALDGDPVDRALVDALRPVVPASWTDLREQCAAGAWREITCAAADAAWMDDGMFSRWCLAGFAEPVEVLLELAEVLVDDVTDHLAHEVVAMMTAGARAGTEAVSGR